MHVPVILCVMIIPRLSAVGGGAAGGGRYGGGEGHEKLSNAHASPALFKRHSCNSTTSLLAESSFQR